MKNLLYVGKKAPLKVKNNLTKGKEITFGAAPVSIPDSIADALLEANPKMFVTVPGGKPDDYEPPLETDGAPTAPPEDGTMEEFDDLPEPEAEEAPEQEPDALVCPKCGKDYKIQKFFDAHVAKCEGPAE